MAGASPLVDTYSLYIDGSWVSPESGRYEGKQSGFGREGGGLTGLHRYMEPKAIGIPA